ncbi:MAG: Gfo/Idh/MocA family oxidoreductase [Rhodospirillaceae bacterium]|nr:Gfo/Idh/MocA family oxidoreductase [Rhodospirillaceae bacterium]
MRALVVGYGSIGQRHVQVLEELGCATAVVSRRSEIGHTPRYDALPAALHEWQPDYVVIANETSEHYGALAALIDAGFTGRVLIEKPAFETVRAVPPARFSHTAVAYNLRQHPLAQALARELKGKTMIEASLHVGQWLPSWRQNEPGHRSYSNSREKGGGALRDLSHELDLALYFFGPWRRLSALGGHFSALAGDSDDSFAITMITARCPSVRVSMNYLDRPARRQIVVNTDAHTYCADLIRGVLEKDGLCIAEHTVERNYTYREQHRAMIDGHTDALCSLEDGLAVMETIAAAESASANYVWVERTSR